NNNTRMFADAARQAQYPELQALAQGMAAPATLAAIEETCGISLVGTYLRIEYCRDTEGFWLEPHTDIGAKRFTMLCYLSVGEGSDPCGTDILADADTFVTTAPFHLNSGVIFIPGNDTWHSFRPRRINGVRKSVMVNFVGPEWRARHELAFENPVK
ncbi:MAG TPA: 2OG-Fe(II) oxygenase, partial [Magnetospirillum sp.]|nr:2OG-Fe(II) oxygenase [Magnetospirillum sp.]